MVSKSFLNWPPNNTNKKIKRQARDLFLTNNWLSRIYRNPKENHDLKKSMQQPETGSNQNDHA